MCRFGCNNWHLLTLLLHNLHQASNYHHRCHCQALLCHFFVLLKVRVMSLSLRACSPMCVFVFVCIVFCCRLFVFVVVCGFFCFVFRLGIFCIVFGLGIFCIVFRLGIFCIVFGLGTFCAFFVFSLKIPHETN